MKLRVVLISIIITVLLCSCNNAGHTNKTNIESINVQDKLIVANNIEIEGRKYESILYCFEGKEIRVLSLTTKESTLIIPSRINGYPVTKIGGDYNNKEMGEKWYSIEQEFSPWLNNKQQYLEQIVVLEGVREIMPSTFYRVKAKEIILPESLEVIRNSAFSNSQAEKVVLKGKDTDLERSAFSGATLKEIAFPDEFRGKIEQYCFEDSGLEKFYWPSYTGNPKNKMKYSVFRNCKNLREIIFPENQEHIYIPRNSFLGCESLEKLEFPATTKKVTYDHNSYADNYKMGVGILVFKGKNTKVVGCEYDGQGDYKFITVSKIVAPKDSKAIKFAKGALKIGYMAKWLQEDIEAGNPQYNYSEGYEPYIKLVSLDYKEI